MGAGGSETADNLLPDFCRSITSDCRLDGLSPRAESGISGGTGSPMPPSNGFRECRIRWRRPESHCGFGDEAGREYCSSRHPDRRRGVRLLPHLDFQVLIVPVTNAAMDTPSWRAFAEGYVPNPCCDGLELELLPGRPGGWRRILLPRRCTALDLVGTSAAFLLPPPNMTRSR